MKKAVSIAALLAIAPFLRAETEVDQSRSDQFEHRTSKSSLVLEATPDSKSIEVTVDAVSKEGRLCWNLTDPLRTQRMRGCGTSGHLMGTSGTLDALPGRWTVNFEYFDSTGETHVRWKIR